MSHSRAALVGILLAAALAYPAPALAQAPLDDPDLDIVPLQPDFTLITLPTTLRVPRFKSAFRVTHRFGRPLGQGDLGDLAADLFGLDSGAQIGLEYRFGIMSGTQVGIHRTSDRTIQFFAQRDLMQERDGRPVSLSFLAAIDGTNNFRDKYSPALGVVVSRSLAPVATVFFEPIRGQQRQPAALRARRQQRLVPAGPGHARSHPPVGLRRG